MHDPQIASPGRRTCLQNLGALGLAASAPGLGAAPAAELAPAIELLASDGQPVLAEGARWRLLYLDFWASWCGPCKLSFPWMNDMHQRHAAAGLRIVAVGLDKRDADAQRFLQQAPARFALAMDPGAESAKRLNVQVMPTSLLITPDRRIVYLHRGFRLEDGPELEGRIKAALA